MNKRTLRCPTSSVLVFGLLLISAVGVAAAEEGPRLTPQARKAFRAAAPPQAMCDGAVTLRSEDLVEWGVVSLTKNGWDGCHTPVSCPPSYASCAGWSDEIVCGDPFCGFADSCGEVCDEHGFCFPQGGPASYAPRERFRVCFDQFQNACTEWQNFAYVTCSECEL